MNIGVLGGGQLAMMLAGAARRLDHTVTVLARPDEPAAETAHAIVDGQIGDVSALEELFRRVDVVTLESELVDVPTLRRLQASHPRVEILPSLSAIEVAQDKLAQKQLFRRCGLRTAPHLELGAEVDSSELRRAADELGDALVLKWARGGYDGHGVLHWNVAQDDAAALEFWAEGVRRGVTVFAEAKVAFTGEVAMVAVRHASGQFANWPLMFTRQREGTCREVYGPAVRMGLSEATQNVALRAARALSAALEYCGVFALEFFLTKEGLVVNEMAPRVHNSGHYTLHESEESQFAAHIRAVTKMPLVTPVLREIAYMRNLLGPHTREFDAAGSPPVVPPSGVALVWYGKRRSKPRRKMGHLTARCHSVDSLRELREQTCFWEQHLWSTLGNTDKDVKWQE